MPVVVAPTLPVGPRDRLITPPTRMILDFINRSTNTLAYLDFGFSMVDVRDIANELGFPQNSIRTALADEIEWLLNGGLIIRHLPYFRKLKIDCL